MERRLDEERLPGLLRAARSLVTERELGRVMERLLSVSRELTGATCGAVGIIDSSRGRYGELLTAGVDPTLRETLRELLASSEPSSLIDGVQPRARALAGEHPGARSFLGVPIILGAEAWGALYLADERPDQFTEADEEMLSALASWAAIAVDNARVHEDNDHRRLELERSVAALEATFEIARAVGGETRVERVLELIADRSRALVGASGVIILLPAGQDFIVAAMAGDVPQSLAGAVVPGGTSVAREVLHTGRPERIRVRDMPEASQSVLTQIGLRPKAALIVPLVFRGNNVGVIEALDRVDGPEFRDVDEHRLQAAGASAATAVATAQTVERERLNRSLQAAEEERGRWARELHDETLQGLGGLLMTLSSARRLRDPAALRAALDRVVEQLGAEIADLRALITELRPASLDQLGLEPALEALFERARTVHDLPVRALVELESAANGRLDAEVETAVYRVVQEALNNAARHAGASVVHVEVLERGDEIRLRVADDGRGFDLGMPSAGFGVPGMRERVTLVGGRLDLVSGTEGTTVTATVPARRCGGSAASEASEPPTGVRRARTQDPLNEVVTGGDNDRRLPPGVQ
jgi:signal transduction histidine kinase